MRLSSLQYEFRGAEFFLGNVDSGRILNFTLAPKPWENCYFTSHERIYLKSIYHYVVFFTQN